MTEQPVKKIFDALTGPEHKSWVRIVDAILTLGCAFAIAVIYFGYAPDFDYRLQHYLFYASMFCLVVIAGMFYRRSDISRLERIAILLLVLTVAFALLDLAFDPVTRS